MQFEFSLGDAMLTVVGASSASVGAVFALIQEIITDQQHETCEIPLEGGFRVQGQGQGQGQGGSGLQVIGWLRL